MDRWRRKTFGEAEKAFSGGGITNDNAAVQSLSVGEDAAVEDRTDGTEDAVQRVRSPVQVRSARAGVSTGGEPDVRADSALELSPEGYGAPTTERAFTAAEYGGATATARPVLLSPSTARL